MLEHRAAPVRDVAEEAGSAQEQAVRTVQTDVPGRVPGLDGLRGVAALAVLLTHVGFQTGYTFTGVLGALTARLEIGVALFFALSGFLLSRPYAAAARGGRRPGLRRYLLHRAARILPAYWLTLLLIAVFLHPLGLRSVGDWGWQLLFVQNYEANHFVPGGTHLWSLATEVAFYVQLPFLARWAWRVRPGARPVRLRTTLIRIGLFGASSLTWPVLVGVVDLDPYVAPLWLPMYAGWFAVGMALAAVEGQPSTNGGLPRRLGELASAPWTCWALAGAVFWLASSPLAGPRGLEARTAVEEIVRVTLYALVVAAVLIPITATPDPDRGPGPAWTPVRVLELPALRHLGAISYPVFLLQLLVLELTYKVLPVERFEGSFVLVLCVAGGLTLVFSELVHRMIEVPVGRLVRRHHRAPAAGTPPQPAPLPR